MALIKCVECGTEVSDKAAACIKCGAPISKPVLFRRLKLSELFVMLVIGIGGIMWLASGSGTDAPTSQAPVPSTAARREATEAPLDFSRPIVTRGASSVICPITILEEKRVGRDLRAATEAATSIFGYEEKVEKAGCEEWKAGIRLLVDKSSKPADTWVFANHGEAVVLAFRYGLQNDDSRPSVATVQQVAAAPTVAPPIATSEPQSTPPADVALVVAAQSRRPSFDCNKAFTKVEKLICGDDTLADLDLQMALVYKAALNTSPDPIAFKVQGIEWRQGVRDKCDDKACLVDAYQMRLQELSPPSTRTQS